MNPMTGNVVSTWVSGLDIWPLVVVLVVNLMFRRYSKTGGYKRMASLYQAIMVFLMTTAGSVVAVQNLTDIYFYLAVVIVITGGLLLRKWVFPYRRTCVECDAKLDIETIYFRNENLCKSCRLAKEAQDKAEAAGEDLEETGVTDAGGDSWPGSGGSETDTENE